MIAETIRNREKMFEMKDKLREDMKKIQAENETELEEIQKQGV